MTKEEYTLKIMITPTHSPCEDCCNDCSLQEKQDGVCEKLNEFNNKIIAKEYDYDKALNKLTKKIGDCLEQGGDEYCCACCALQTLIGKQI
jgi:hypothetical protein